MLICPRNGADRSALKQGEKAATYLTLKLGVIWRHLKGQNEMARLQLDLSDTSEALVEKIMELCDLKTKKDAVENALMLLGWAASNVSDGRIIAAVDEDQKVYKEINTTALEGAAHYAERKKRSKGKAGQPGGQLKPT